MQNNEEPLIISTIMEDIRFIEKFPLRVQLGQKRYWLKLDMKNEKCDRKKVVNEVLQKTGRKIRWIGWNEIEIDMTRKAYCG